MMRVIRDSIAIELKRTLLSNFFYAQLQFNRTITITITTHSITTHAFYYQRFRETYMLTM